ncbi:MAG: hypothetical protein ACOC2V_05010 [Alkalispirochaeta sp.]
MGEMIGRIVIGGIVGLPIGYFVFGEIAGVRLEIGALIPSGADSGIGGALRNAAGNLAGINEIRRNILLSGAGGAVLGMASTVLGRRR